MRVDGERLWQTLAEFARIGATPDGGVERIALTECDAEARALLAAATAELGCANRVDAVGNAFHRLDGTDPDLAAVMIGSHLDSQPGGGRFDGALGVLAGLEVLRTVAAGSRPARSIELVDWTDEEGARFDVSCIGSSVYSGDLALEDAYALEDADGISLRSALDQLGAIGAPSAQSPPRAYLELHIEQGPVLEAEGVPIGVVEGIFGISWHTVRIVGASGHAGTTPSQGRRDALLAAADLIRAVEQIAGRHGEGARGSVCAIEAQPNSGSVLVGETQLLVDLRHLACAELEAMEAELEAELERLRERGFEVTSSLSWGQGPVAFDPDCVAAVEQSARALELPFRRMPSGAGHDAGYVARVAPAAMVFVPCAGGVSHNPAESVTLEDATAGADVLLASTLALCER